VTDGAVPEPSSGKRPGWWKRRSKLTKALIILAVIILIIVAATSGSSKKDDKIAADTSTATSTEKADAASNNGPVFVGTWNAECNQFSAGDEGACHALRVSRVTCQWRDSRVHMTVIIKNTYGAHVTVHMNPIYNLQNAGVHGDGLSAVQDIGLDPGELRTYETDQEPHGVKTQPAITSCRPGVDTLQGVELG
jgi:hypothetical protein